MPISCADDLAALDFHGDLGQRARGRACNHLRAFGRVEDRAVAGAGELAVLVGNLAALVRADRRVRHEVAVMQVDQDRRVSRVLEGDGATRRDVGLGGDSRLVRIGLAWTLSKGTMPEPPPESPPESPPDSPPPEPPPELPAPPPQAASEAPAAPTPSAVPSRMNFSREIFSKTSSFFSISAFQL